MAVWGSGAEPKQEGGYKGVMPAPVDPLAGKGRCYEIAKCHCAFRGLVCDG